MNKYINREISWLSFNDRVLQEAADKRTPLIERIKFLGIFSSNLDEFFRVRVATVKRLADAGGKIKMLFGEKPADLLADIQNIVIRQQNTFDEIYESILNELEAHNIHIINEKQLDSEQEAFVKNYFQEAVRPRLFPIMLDKREHFPMLKDHSIYLAVSLRKKETSKKAHFALIEIPTGRVSRFLVLPKRGHKTYIMFLDDVIRAGLPSIFSMFGYTIFEAYTIKLTRDAELDIDEDITKSFFEKISKSLKQRKEGVPVRFVYDSAIPADYLKEFIRKNELTDSDSLIPGGRYHNSKDFMKFPSVGLPELQNEPMPPIPHPKLNPNSSILAVMRKQDILLHYPYQSFSYIIDLLREASLDPRVVSIKMTLYRVAQDSSIITALIRAIRNGKKVTVVIELQARFDEEANIQWTKQLREEGVHIIHGVPNLKVHSKLCLITRRERGQLSYYVNVATGNYNENTARLYSDHSLLTTDSRITGEVASLFDFFETNYRIGTYKHLIVSPFFMRERIGTAIDREIENARAGRDAYIIIKSNSLNDKAFIDRLYEAGDAGVKVQLIIRGICSIVPGVKGLSENISVISIVDRFLEHSRIYVFGNGGDPEYYISSADWMTRNIDNRVEVGCPIYDPDIKQQLQDFLDVQLRDNTKARIIDADGGNRYRSEKNAAPVRAQIDFYRFLKKSGSKG